MALSKRDRRSVLILGAVVAVFAVSYMLFFSGGGSKSATTTLNTGSQVPVVAPSPSPSGADPGEALVFSGRDPFQPLLGTNTDPGTPIPGGTTPSVSPAGSPPSGPTGGSSTTIGGHTVVLVDIFTSGGVQKVQVEVDGTVYTVAAGDSFSDSFQLSSIDGDCANFLFGDQPFTLCQTANK